MVISSLAEDGELGYADFGVSPNNFTRSSCTAPRERTLSPGRFEFMVPLCEKYHLDLITVV